MDLLITKLSIDDRRYNCHIADFIPLDKLRGGIRSALSDVSIKAAVSTEEVIAEDVRLQAVVIMTGVPGANILTNTIRVYVVQTSIGTDNLLRAYYKGPSTAKGAAEQQASRHARLAGAPMNKTVGNLERVDPVRTKSHVDTMLRQIIPKAVNYAKDAGAIIVDAGMRPAATHTNPETHTSPVDEKVSSSIRYSVDKLLADDSMELEQVVLLEVIYIKKHGLQVGDAAAERLFPWNWYGLSTHARFETLAEAIFNDRLLNETDAWLNKYIEGVQR